MATLDEIVSFYFSTATPAHPEDIELLVKYDQTAVKPSKFDYVQFLVQHAQWLGPRCGEVKFKDPGPEVTDWNPVVRALHEKYDPHFPGADTAKRAAAQAHWNTFLTMADAFGICRYERGVALLSSRALAKLTRELEIFGDGYYGVDDLLGVLLKVEALRGDTSWIVRPPPFMLETCDALARRLGIESYFRFSPRLRNGGCRVLDLACGSGIYSNALADKGNECVAVDMTRWVFYRAFLAAHPGVSVECFDMNALPKRIIEKPFTHVMSNIAAHHFKDRVGLFKRMRSVLAEDGELCVLNFNYSLRQKSSWNPIAKLKRQFAAQIQYNWTVLEFERGGVQFISPQDVAQDLESAGFSAQVHPCDPLKELFLVLGRKR
jgi:ubiquinone/menaquinone biosynthesis C-methylase UbiE